MKQMKSDTLFGVPLCQQSEKGVARLFYIVIEAVFRLLPDSIYTVKGARFFRGDAPFTVL